MDSLKRKEREYSKKPLIGSRLLTFLGFFIVLMVFAILGFFAYFAYLSPVEKLKHFNESFNPKPHTPGLVDYRADTDLFRLKQEEAFLSSKIAILATDSIYLSVNLKDQVVSIEIQGVVMHQVKISSYSKSGIFNSMEGIALINQFSSPFKIDSSFATIEKDPFILKIAPQDTIEAQKDVSTPDTARSELVVCSLYLDKGILLQISQSEEDKSRSTTKYKMRKRYESTMNFIRTALTFRVPEYQPYISIEIPAKDARAIYRAIPKKALIAIRLE